MMTKKDAPHPIDAHVGTRMKQRRILHGMSQSDLATALGLTFQQVQKYERGANRISASRLYEMAAALDVSVAWFFEDFPGASPAQRRPASVDPLVDRKTLKLARAYHRIPAAGVRAQVFALVKALAGTPETADVEQAA